MKDQKFLEEDWDYAVILDSARFDIFQEVYQDYFEGRLEKRKSPASTSAEWIEKVLYGDHDIVWFSANFFINSIERPISDSGYTRYEVTPTEHIDRIIDLWASEWSEQGTVRPERVTDRVLGEKDEIDQRTVLHYMQPHLPIPGKGKSILYNRMQRDFLKMKQSEFEQKERFKNYLEPFLRKLDEFSIVQKLNWAAHLDRKNFLRFLLKSGDTAREIHEENLRKVLEEVQRAVEDIDGKVVITSDHGEAFGEKGVWGHKAGKNIPELAEVPWLEVKDVK
jgi:hypothetical protein